MHSIYLSVIYVIISVGLFGFTFLKSIYIHPIFFLLRSIYWLRHRYSVILRKYVWDFQRKYVEDNKRVKRVRIVFGDEQDSGDDI